MKILRVSAATMKNSDPMKKICMTTMERNGCRYHAQMVRPDAGVIGPRRERAQEGSDQHPRKRETVVTKEPAQRPPR